MDMVFTAIQFAARLFESLNALCLCRRDHRGPLWKVWRQEPLIFRMAYVLRVISLVVLIALTTL